MSSTILLVTSHDRALRKPLLESQGYKVEMISSEAVADSLQRARFDLVLIPTDDGVNATLACCEQIKRIDSKICVGVIAQRAEYVPPHPAVDAVIRQQYSPEKFLATIRNLLDGSPLADSFSAGESE